MNGHRQYQLQVSCEVSREQLASTALGILTIMLEGYGNVLSARHRAALASMLDAFAAYVTGEARGRRAFPLPTGMGKTAAVVAFITALERCGYTVPVAVAASQVQALCKVHQALIAQGVPVHRIGLKHSLLDAPVASTGDAEHLYQMVTHARVRGGTDFALFGEYQGQPRALCLYDETLWRADTASLRVSDDLEERLGIQFAPLGVEICKPFGSFQGRLEDGFGALARTQSKVHTSCAVGVL